MEVDLNEDQELLATTAAKFMDAVCPLTTVRELVNSATGVSDIYLSAAGELGWFSLLVSEADGGGSVSGEGLSDAAIVAQARGRRLQPGPFIPMNVVASALAATGSTHHRLSVLPSILAGESVAAWAVADGAGVWEPGRGLSATAAGTGFVLSGRATPVQDGSMANWLLVSASGDEGLTQFLVPASTPGVTVTPLRAHDITQRFATVQFDNVELNREALVGEPEGATKDVLRQLDLALVLSVAETVGALDALFEMTRRYAIDRVAFGRPIGSFQAVKHQLADMSLSVEAGKAISSFATRAVQRALPDGPEIASMAKAWVGDTGIAVAQGCFQIFAGIGYTWEHDLHLFLRRITMNSLLFGQSDWHRERICEIHGL